MSAKKKHRNANEYLQYLKGELSGKERHSFERGLEADPFEMEAMEGLEMLAPGEVEEDLLSIHDRLRKRLHRRRRRTIYSIAATVASLLIISTVFINIYDFNPKSSKESIPNDESYLHDMPGTRSTEMKEEQAPEKQDLQVEDDNAVHLTPPAQQETRAREETQEQKNLGEKKNAQVQERARVEQPSGEEIVVREGEAVKAGQGITTEPEQQAILEDKDLYRALEDQEAEQYDRMEEALVPEKEPEFDVAKVAEVPEEKIPEEEAPAPVAGQVVTREAQPGRSQKKGRALQAPSSPSVDRVNGVVVSSVDMKPLPGATILVMDSDSEVVTDQNGRFSVAANQQAQATVIASYAGMKTDEYQLSTDKLNQLVMQPDLSLLNETVVIGHEGYYDLNITGAEPEGGLEAFKMYIEEHIRFPAGDTMNNREVVLMRFIVDEKGNISHIESLSSPGQPFTEEVIRLLLNGPGWKPARNENGPTQDVVRMRIVFKK